METFSALLAICVGNSPVPGEFPTQRPVTRSFDVFFDLRLNKQLSKQWWGWWFETLSRPLWRHRNDGTNRGSVLPAPNDTPTKTSRRLVGRDWPLVKHWPITTKLSTKSFRWKGSSSASNVGPRSSIHWAGRRLTAKSPEAPKPRDEML